MAGVPSLYLARRLGRGAAHGSVGLSTFAMVLAANVVTVPTPSQLPTANADAVA